MADCLSDIIAGITSNCTTEGVGGNEIKGWIGQRQDFTFTYDVTNPSKVTGITALSTKQLFPILVSKKGLNSGHDKVIDPARSGRFTHFVGLPVQEFDAATTEQIDNMQDVIVVVESKDKDNVTGDGVFRGFGFKYGLEPVTDSMRANDANGMRPIELGPIEGDTEPHSHYTVLDTDYATTKAMLIALETPAA